MDGKGKKTKSLGQYSILGLVLIFTFGCGPKTSHTTRSNTQESKTDLAAAKSDNAIVYEPPHLAESEGINLSAIRSQSGTFGFNYWPLGKGPDVLYNQNWPRLAPEVAADLDQLKSLGAQVVRLVFWPKISGYPNPGDPNPKNTFMHLDEITKNLPSFLAMLAERDLKVIIAFGNTYLTNCEETDSQGRCSISSANTKQWPWWLRTYGGKSDPNNFKKFLDDSLHWINHITETAEKSQAGKHVLYYDAQNESTDLTDLSWNYLDGILTWAKFPAQKKGVSILRIPALEKENTGDIESLKKIPSFQSLRYISFHPYPRSEFGVGFTPEKIVTAYEQLRSALPGKTILSSEFGSWGANNPSASPCSAKQQCEDIQYQALGKSIDALIKARSPFFLQWMLWDNTPGPVHQQYGIGTSHHLLKKAYEAVLSRTSLLKNSSFEDAPIKGIEPSFWSHGSWGKDGGGTTKFSRLGPNDSASGQYYGRLQTSKNQVGSGLWVASHGISVSGGKHLYFNSFVRAAGLKNIRMEIHEYTDNFSQKLNHYIGPTYTPRSWSFRNYRHQIASDNRSVRLLLKSATKIVIVAIAGEHDGQQQIFLDVDALTISQ